MNTTKKTDEIMVKKNEFVEVWKIYICKISEESCHDDRQPYKSDFNQDCRTCDYYLESQESKLKGEKL